MWITIAPFVTVADKGFRMVRYYGFLSPAKRRLLEEVVYAITETVRKTAMQIRWRGMYQRLLKVDPLKCILCVTGSFKPSGLFPSAPQK